MDQISHPDSYAYYLYNQKNIEDISLYQFLGEHHSNYYDSRPNIEDGNIKAWSDYINNDDISTDDISEVVYKSKKEDLIQLLDLPTANPILPENKLIQYWAKNPDRTAIEYLIYAKECEPFATSYKYYWQEEDPRDHSTMQTLLERGKKLYAGINNVAIKMRYAYQIVRLAHYMEDYPKVLDLFDEFVKPLGTQSYMYYRALEHKAGALVTIGDPEAFRFLAIVFDQLPDRRRSSVIGLNRINNQETWNEALDFCQTKGERAALHAMRAYLKAGDNLDEINNILDVDNQSPYIELLVVREIKNIEREVYSVFQNRLPSYYRNYGHLQLFYAACEQAASYAKPERAEFLDGYASIY